nr:hypothetical protein [Tanacetum cinerariifolium]
MMQLVPIEEVYVQALQVKHPIIDWKVYIEGQRSYWKIIRRKVLPLPEVCTAIIVKEKSSVKDDSFCNTPKLARSGILGLGGGAGANMGEGGHSIGGSGGKRICGGEDQRDNGDAGGEDITRSLTTSELVHAGIDSGTYSGDWAIGEASLAYGWSSATISSSACSGPGI